MEIRSTENTVLVVLASDGQYRSVAWCVTGNLSVATYSETMDNQDSISQRLLRWVFLDGNRLSITIGVSVAVFLLTWDSFR